MNQLFYPRGIIVDQMGTVYVVDQYNHRIMRWLKGATEGSVAVDGYAQARQENQFSDLNDLSFDRYNNFYAVDYGRHRILKFNIEP